MALPTGTVTFLFSDIEGSTRLWEESPGNMKASLTRHDAVLRGAIESHGGYIFTTAGDAFSAAFQASSDALDAAITAQRMLQSEQWGGEELRVRMALHSGEADERDGDYFGPTLNRTARLLSTAVGREVIVSEAMSALLRDSLPLDSSLVDLGDRELPDLSRPERVFRVTAPASRAIPALDEPTPSRASA